MKLARIVSSITASAVLMTTLGSPRNAQASGVFVGATEITQLLNHIQLLMQYEQQIQQYATQMQQWETELRNGANLAQQFFGPIRQDMIGLQRTVQGGNALSYAMANLDSQFTSKYPGYTSPQSASSFAQRYATWSQTSLDSTQKALDAAGLQNSQMDTEQDLLGYLETASQSADGQLKAIQVGNQIAEQQVQQMMKLRQLIMADMQSKSAFQNQQIMQQQQAAQSRTFFQTSGRFSSTGSAASGVSPAASVSPR